MRLHIAIEQSPGVRRAALAIHGPKMPGVRLLVSKTYGKLGAGFAEVHHLEPFKNIRSAKFVNPGLLLVWGWLRGPGVDVMGAGLARR